MYSIYRESVEQYEALMKQPYDDAKYPSPASIPSNPELLKLVSKIKYSQAHNRKTDIYLSMQRLSGGRVFVATEENKHWLEEVEQLEHQLELWDYSHL